MISATTRKKNNVSIEGNLDAPQTIIFAHGFGTDQTAWDAVKEAFKADYRIVLYDNVGAGAADINAYSPIKYNTLQTYANDLLDIASELDLKGAIVVAHSVSSMISVIAANKSPEHFSKLVLVGASPRYLNDGQYVGGFTQDALDGMYETMTTNYYAWVSGFSAVAMGNPDKPELGEEFAKTLREIRPDIALAVVKVIFESDVRNQLPVLNLPTLLLQTKEDIAVPGQVAAYLNDHIKNSVLQILDAEGHFPHISAPDTVIKSIQSFI
ncbi:alpha/beta fold hydrolase [Pedobacter duraquae]|uniref:Sigma-B regulation protein RsbQ n=1 Tax=Pedobacter duraquae TaxID=425511 RepID=A0A4R6IKR1_9SPHI|nr:alpha/beta hydrolase [Pedobacter duraquae]TDO22679.1 sigma-B regulation protein RsbQ [Pedobacter duraquae]